VKGPCIFGSGVDFDFVRRRPTSGMDFFFLHRYIAMISNAITSVAPDTC
jgi:hypothetical protein